MPINAGRLSVIFRELKSLPLDKYPNAAAVLLRVFVELTVDSYIGKKHIAGVSANSELGKKVEAVAADLESRGIMSKHELLAARKMATGQYQTQSVQTFHSYIHNANITPIARDLRSAWDDISKFIDSIWREI